MIEDLAQFYDSYGETLAERMPDICHTEAEPRFILMTENSMDELTKFVTKLRSGVFIMAWEQFGEELSDGRRDNYHTKLTGTLAILTKPHINDTHTRRAAQRACRVVALRAIAQMRVDALEKDAPLWSENIRFDMDGQGGDYIGLTANGYVGYGYGFSWLVPLDLSV